MIRHSEPRLNHTQKVRLQRALNRLCDPNSGDLVTVADSIPCDGFLSKGHGTSEIGGEAVATVCGVVERVNKHVSVRPLRSRYHHGRGDIVLGRVLEVSAQRWRTEINCRRNAVLMLSSVNFSDGVQRRRSDEDELNMRNSFIENDVICAEVCDLKPNGLHLQARTLKHGKLERGQLLRIPPYLVKRQKQHYHHLEQYGIDLILGSNGFVWIGQHKEEDKDKDKEEEETCIAMEIRQNICRVANAVRVVTALGFTVTVQVIIQTVHLSHAHNVDIHEMLGSEFYVLVAEEEAERRSSNKRKRIST